MTKQDDEDRKRVAARYKELYDSDPILRAIAANREGDLDKLNKMFFIDKEVDVLRVTPVEQWNWLHRALLLCYPEIPPVSTIKFYIEHGVPVNAQDVYGMTPLHYAMRGKNVGAAIALLEAGADPNIPDIDRASSLAYIHGMPEEIHLLELMLQKGGDVHFHNGQHEVLEGVKKYRSNDPRFAPVIELMEKYA